MSRPEERLPEDLALREPWQAEALALAIALQESGAIDAAEWSATLAEVIEDARRSGDPADGTTYGNHVLTALEALLQRKGLVSAAGLVRRRQEWVEAYRRTPHGQPVRLPGKDP